jgi:hypothetical protein
MIKKLLLSVFAAVFFVGGAFAALPNTISFQGMLSDTGGPVTGTYDLHFDIYENSSGGSPVETLNASGTQVANGLYSVNVDVDDPTIFESARWLQVRVGNTALGGRVPITITPYSMYAQYAANVDLKDIKIGDSTTPGHILVTADGTTGVEISTTTVIAENVFVGGNSTPGTVLVTDGNEAVTISSTTVTAANVVVGNSTTAGSVSVTNTDGTSSVTISPTTVTASTGTFTYLTGLASFNPTNLVVGNSTTTGNFSVTNGSTSTIISPTTVTASTGTFTYLTGLTEVAVSTGTFSTSITAPLINAATAVGTLTLGTGTNTVNIPGTLTAGTFNLPPEVVIGNTETDGLISVTDGETNTTTISPTTVTASTGTFTYLTGTTINPTTLDVGSSSSSGTIVVTDGTDTTTITPTTVTASTGTFTHLTGVTINPTTLQVGDSSTAGSILVTNNGSSGVTISTSTVIADHVRVGGSSGILLSYASLSHSPTATLPEGTPPEGHVLNVDGNINVTSGHVYSVGAADLAEIYPSTENLEPGDVVSISKTKDFNIEKTKTAYDTAVAGIISTEPGMVLNSKEKGYRLALAGQVPVKVTNEGGQIKRGDILVSSSKSGYAMKAGEIKTGTIVGKALENFSGSEGKIVVLVNLQ